MKYIASHIVTTPDLALNHNLFGGTLMIWCDQYGALFTYRYLHHKFVTYKIEKIYFNKPGKEGDLIDFYMDNLKFNKISVEFDLIAINNENGNELIRTSCTFVAIDRETEKAVLMNPFKFEKQEFEAFVKQRIKPKEGTKLPKVSITKEPDLAMYRKKYVAELYIQTYQDGATAITMFQKDYGKLISVSEVTDVISYMNKLIIAAQQTQTEEQK